MKTNNKNFKQLISDIIIFLFGTVLAKVVQFFLMPLYTSSLSLQAYGTAELINNLSELFLPIVTLCIYESILRYTIEDNENKSSIISTAICIFLVSLSVSIPFIYISRQFFNFNYNLEFFLVVCFYALQKLFSCYVRAKDLSKVFAFNGAINALFLAIFSVIFIIILRTNITGYLTAIWLSYFISCIYLFIFGRIYKDLNFSKIQKSIGKKLIKFGLPLIPYNIMYFFTTLSGRYILLWKCGESEVGMYIAVIKITTVVNLLQQAVSMAIQISVSKEYKENNKEEYYSFIFNLFTVLFWIFGSGMICISPLLSKITLQKDFYRAHIYLPILLFAAIINCISSMYGTLFLAYKRTRNIVPIILVGMIVNILLCLALVPSLRILGVCISSLISYLCQIIYKLVDINKFCHIEFEGKKIFVIILICIGQVLLVSTDNRICWFVSWMFFVNLLLMLWKRYQTNIKKLIRRH